MQSCQNVIDVNTWKVIVSSVINPILSDFINNLEISTKVPEKSMPAYQNYISAFICSLANTLKSPPGNFLINLYYENILNTLQSTSRDTKSNGKTSICMLDALTNIFENKNYDIIDLGKFDSLLEIIQQIFESNYVKLNEIKKETKINDLTC